MRAGRHHERLALAAAMVSLLVVTVAGAAVLVLRPAPIGERPVSKASGCAPGARTTAGGGPVPASCRSVWWGLYEANNADATVHEACPAGGSSVCRRFDVFSRYYDLSTLASPPPAGRWPTVDDARLARGGRVLFLTISLRCEGPCPTTLAGQPLPPPEDLAIAPSAEARPQFRPQDAAEGRLDPLLHAAADALRVFPGTVVASLGPPIDQVVTPMPAELRAEWEAAYARMARHVHDLFAKDGVTNVAWSYMVAGVVGDSSVYARSYPGDAYVDWISWTAYDRACSVGSAYALMAVFYQRLQEGLLGAGALSKPYALREYGAGAGCQAARLRTVVAGLQRLPRIRAFIYFSPTDDVVTLTPSGWAAFADAGRQPYVMPPPP